MPARREISGFDSSEVVTVALPSTSLGELFGFSAVPLSFLLLIAMIVAMYIVSAEIAKAVFYKFVVL